jgi:regulator of sigma E protease
MTITILYSILGFILAIGLLTTVHEYGHFWMARRLGVKVLRFSIGFGKSLLSWHDKQGTEYVIAAIPLGGYVKMLDQNEGIVAPNDLHHAFNNKPVWGRMLIIAAGPAFNLLFAILAYWAVFMWGVASIVPVLGEVPKGSIAYTAGLRSGEEILAVDDHQTATWEDIAVALVSHIGDYDFVNIKVRDIETNVVSDHVLNLNNWSIDDGDQNIIKNLGLEPLDPTEPIVGSVMADMPAAKVGLQPGDRFISIDGVSVTSRSQVLETLRNKYEHAVHLVMQRNGENIPFLITPNKKILEGGEPTGFIGIQFENQPWPEKLIRVQRYSPIAAFPMALKRTKDYTVLTLQFIGKMVTGKMSLDHVAGPISIAKFAGRTVRSGVEYFLGFLAIVSISLGVLNMLPIPILDGGHFLFCTIELVRGKALSQRAMQMGYMLGFVLLGSFMMLALYNDVIRIAM